MLLSLCLCKHTEFDVFGTFALIILINVGGAQRLQLDVHRGGGTRIMLRPLCYGGVTYRRRLCGLHALPDDQAGYPGNLS
jgi:hypothetical protein